MPKHIINVAAAYATGPTLIQHKKLLGGTLLDLPDEMAVMLLDLLLESLGSLRENAFNTQINFTVWMGSS